MGGSGARAAIVMAVAVAALAVLWALTGERSTGGDVGANYLRPSDPAAVGSATVAPVPRGENLSDAAERREPIAAVADDAGPPEDPPPTIERYDGPGAILTGVLLEHDGRPVPGAVLEVSTLADPYSSMIRLQGMRASPFLEDRDASDRAHTDAGGRFDLRLAELTARAGFGHALVAHTRDGRVEALAMPRIVDRERCSGLVLRLPPRQRIDLTVDVPMGFVGLDQRFHADPARRRMTTYARGSVAAAVRWFDREGRIHEDRARHVGGNRMTVWIVPDAPSPVTIELDLTGHELVTGPVEPAGAGRFTAHLQAVEQRHVILALRSASNEPRGGIAVLELRGRCLVEGGRPLDRWGVELEVELGELPYDVALAVADADVDHVSVHADSGHGIRLELAAFDPQRVSFHPVELPLVATQPPDEPFLPMRTGFDVHPNAVTATATLVDASTGEPIEGVTAVRSGTGGPLIHRPASARSDRHGRLVAAGIPVRTATALGFESADFEFHTVEVPALAAGAHHDLGRLELTPLPLDVRLRVADAEGDPVAGQRVRVGLRTRTTDADGRVEFPRPHEGDTAIVEILDSARRSFPVRLGAGEQELRLRPTRLVELRLRGDAVRARAVVPAEVHAAEPAFSIPLATPTWYDETAGRVLAGAPDGERWILLELTVGAHRLDLGGDGASATLEILPGDGRQVFTLGDA